MAQRKKLTRWQKAKLAAAGLLGALSLQSAPVQAEGFEFPAVRTRVEQTENDLSTTRKLTFGLSPRDTPGAGREFFRMYHYDLTARGKEPVSYSSVGLAFPWRIGRTEHRTTIFGEFGHELHEGFGIQDEIMLDRWKLTLNFDRKNFPRTTHYGADLEYRFGDPIAPGVSTGFGLDRVTAQELKRTQALAHAEWDIDKNNQLAAALRHIETNSPGKLTEDKNSLLLLYLHYGPDQVWGTRTWAEVWRDSASKTRGFAGNILFSQYPSMPRICSATFTRRNSGCGYSLLQVEDPVNYIERTPLPLRVRSDKAGFAADLIASGKQCELTGLRTLSLGAELGYRFGPITKGVNPGATIFFSNSRTSGSGKPTSTQEYGCSLIVPTTRTGNRWLDSWIPEIQLKRTSPSNGKPDTTVYFSITKEF
jgi:hypothetical protein